MLTIVVSKHFKLRSPSCFVLAELYLLSWSNLESIGTFPGPLKNRKLVDELVDNIDIFRLETNE